MKQFADLYRALDESNKTTDKVSALTEYFQAADPADAAWALYFLIGRKPRQVVPSRKMAYWSAEVAGIPEWLFDESYDAVGDLAETITLLLPQPTSQNDLPLHKWIEERLLPMRSLPEALQKEALLSCWSQMTKDERFVWNKLITGAFRIGVSKLLVIRALARVANVEQEVIAHRLMGNWEPSAEFFRQTILSSDTRDAVVSRPYPFFLAYPIDDQPEKLGDSADWQVEWKWDGIRSQIIHRQGEVYIWSRGEELVTDRFPELAMAATRLPDGTVLDGEILPWKDGQVMPFAQLQRRIGRKDVSKKILAEVPVAVMAYDLLEAGGNDVRNMDLSWRRNMLESIIQQVDSPVILTSELVYATNWEELRNIRQGSRERSVEGLMLKRKTSPYRSGRVRGDWWKWKIDPYSVDAVLIYAQRGSGRRASLYTDYTFGVWDEDGNLVPFAKAYSGLSDEEIRKVDSFVRRNSLDKFGPVRVVKPELVFELAFEGIQLSSRHKSGVAVRFPRMARWRTDKKPEEADTLATVKALISGGKGA